MSRIIANVFLLTALLGLTASVGHAQQSKNVDVVYVIGNVKNPAGITLVTGIRLRDALESAGGVKRKSRKVQVAHYRVVDGKLKQARANLKSIMKQESQNVLLEPYDLIDLSDDKGSFGHAIIRILPF